MRNDNNCPICAGYNRIWLEIMRQHLKAEQELAHAMFVAADGPAATEANQRALLLIEKGRQVRMQTDSHWLVDHEQADGALVNA